MNSTSAIIISPCGQNQTGWQEKNNAEMLQQQ